MLSGYGTAPRGRQVVVGDGIGGATSGTSARRVGRRRGGPAA